MTRFESIAKGLAADDQYWDTRNLLLALEIKRGTAVACTVCGDFGCIMAHETEEQRRAAYRCE